MGELPLPEPPIGLEVFEFPEAPAILPRPPDPGFEAPPAAPDEPLPVVDAPPAAEAGEPPTLGEPLDARALADDLAAPPNPDELLLSCDEPPVAAALLEILVPPALGVALPPLPTEPPASAVPPEAVAVVVEALVPPDGQAVPLVGGLLEFEPPPSADREPPEVGEGSELLPPTVLPGG